MPSLILLVYNSHHSSKLHRGYELYVIVPIKTDLLHIICDWSKLLLSLQLLTESMQVMTNQLVSSAYCLARPESV